MTLEHVSSSGHRDSHEAGNEPNPSARKSEPLAEELDEAVRAETLRLFTSTRWLSPIGNVGAALVLILATPGSLPTDRWLPWLAAMVAVAVVMVVDLSRVPTAGRTGIPHVLRASHVVAGSLWGLTLWLDADATADGQYRWTAMATLFAVTAGSSAGLSGLNQLSILVQIPMWGMTSAALFTVGEYVAGAGVLVFLGLVIPHQGQSGRQFRELITLRLSSQRTAEASAWAANHDELTSLVNRAGVFRALESAAPETTAAALFIDLDHFKAVNDRFGHAAGDEVLVEVAERLRACFRPTDVVARLGGDEFVVVLEGEVEDHVIDRLARRAISRLEEPVVMSSDEEAYISASIGVARITSNDTDPERLLTEADHALYRAKRTGRRRVVRFDSSMEAELQRRTGLETSLRKAIRDGTIQTYGQPILNLQSGDVMGVELLARWPLTDGNVVPPSVFIPLAEETGLIDDLSDTMVDRAGALLQRWGDHPTHRDIQVGINVSPVQLTRGALVESLAETVTARGLAPGRLVVELTESPRFHEDGDLRNLLGALHELGVLIAIDDFGTGYSSLSSLLDFPITFLKLDRSLIADLGRDPRRRTIIAAIHQLAEVVGQVVIAEGIEMPDQVQHLRDLGVRSGQGFGLANPVPLDELDDYIAERAWADVISWPAAVSAADGIDITGRRG